MNDESGTIEFIHSINPWWDNKSYRFKSILRKDYINPTVSRNDRLIDIFIGARRVGKTTIMQMIINHLLEQDINPKRIIFLSAEIKELQKRGIKYILDQLKINYFGKVIYIFIDEVQEIENWQNEVKLLYDNTKIKFYLSGSSSLILNQKTSKLTGRFILQKVLPLSFSEFLQFTHKKISKSKSNNSKLLNEYLLQGGYPEYVLNKNRTYLRQSIESTLYRDLLAVYGIRNPKILEDLLYFLADKVTTPVSANRIKKDLKIDDKTASFYLQYLEDVYLIYPVYRFGSSNKITKSSTPKYYFNDTGVLNLFGMKTRIGHLAENAVFLKLLREQNSAQTHKIFYNVINGQEIDFIYKDINYEVKGYSELDQDEVEKYDLLDTQITIVAPDLPDRSKLFYSPNIQYEDLVDFLS